MKKSLLLGAMVLAAATVSTAASADEYGFYSTYGGAYCDGLSFTPGSPAVGQHIYDQTYCVYPDANLGGFESKIKGLKSYGKGAWYTFPLSQATGDGDPSSYTLVFYANTKALLWVLYFENTDYGVTYELLNSGTLQKGPPFAHVSPKAKHLGSVIHESLAAFKLKK